MNNAVIPYYEFTVAIPSFQFTYVLPEPGALTCDNTYMTVDNLITVDNG
jgi:hypothetical protein